MTQQPEALRLADALWALMSTVSSNGVLEAAAAELRRLHAELERCKQVCAATSEGWRADAETRDDIIRMALEAMISFESGTNGLYEGEFAQEIAALRAALAEPVQDHFRDATKMVQEPVAWRTFDGEGGYDYRTYEDNESYAAEWEKRNPRHVGWVEPLYTAPRPAEPVQEPVQQALVEADRIMGHDDEATEWRERWAHLFGVAGSATSPWRESAVQDCSPGGTRMPATPPQRPAEPMVWTTQFDINWALNNPGRAGSFYANKEGSNDIALYTTPPVCGRGTEPVQEPYAWMSVGGSIWRHKTTEDDVPLYTAPLKPLAEWQINDLMSDIDPEDRDSWSFRQGVYAAEKHHGVRR